MPRTVVSLWVAASLLAMIALGAVVASEASQLSDKRSGPAPAEGVNKGPVVPGAKPVEKADAKPKGIDPEKKPDSSTVAEDRASEVEAIRVTGEAYVKAYADADAKAIAAMFTPDAEYIDEQGNVYQGREDIEKVMTEFFAENKDCRIAMDIETLRFISAGVAVEDGTTTFTSLETQDPVYSRYTAVHVKINGKWLCASVREHAPKDRRQHRAQLQQLAWLQGDWVDEGEDSVVIFSCAEVDGGNFLLRRFTIQVAGQEALSGTQRIGWDPITGRLRAWIFDSEGGFSEGLWHRDGDSWVLKSTGVTADGQAASSTSIYTLVNEHTMTWQSIDHEIAGVQLPDSEVVTVVRRAPVPTPVDVPPLSKPE